MKEKKEVGKKLGSAEVVGDPTNPSINKNPQGDTIDWNKADEIFRDGEHIDDWACDTADGDVLESNGGIENICLYNNKYYSIITDWKQKLIYKHKDGSPMVSETEYKESG